MTVQGFGELGKRNEPRGVLAVCNDVDPKNETDYNEWYFQQHLLERLGVPGFLTGRRYVAIGGGPKYFTYYTTTSVEIMRSPAYLERVNNPTDWTRRNMAFFRNMSRTACRETLDMGRGIGSTAVTMGIRPAAGQENDLRKWIAESFFPDLLKSPGASGIIRGHLWEGDPGVSTQKTAEQALRGGKDQMVDWVLVIEASSPAQAEKASQMLAAYSFVEWGAESVEPPLVYRLLHYLPGPDGR
ncbi:MAG: hypothetical protein HY882_00595 [Deltaproteobacteria bacterium]|nr:hypothetical protein [Deltaproteobacteria bacterium]